MKTFCFSLLLCFSTLLHAQLYFPPIAGNTWQTVSPASLGWCQDKVDTLTAYLGRHNTKAFILLKDGKIAIERYYGSFTSDSIWYWASAGKSLTAFLVGLAQEQGYLNIHDSLPKYLGHGFSSCTASAEDSIRIIHQLTMTTGFDDKYGGSTTENHCTDDSCLVCMAAPGTRWAYHNAPYTMLDTVIQSATGQSISAWKTSQLNLRTGITGTFVKSDYDNVYFSKPRSFARFGLLMLNHGAWQTDTIMHDTSYYSSMIRSSQNINLSYGYLWWLNGKASYHIPNYQVTIPGMICPHAPADMYAALGKNDQILNVVPSRGLVWIRMGEPFNTSTEVATSVADSIWVRLNEVFCSSVPLHLISFKAYNSGQSNLLQWQLAPGSSIKEIIVERSNGSLYNVIGTLKTLGNDYSFTDEQPSYGLNVYRLTLVGYDGSREVSEARVVNNSPGTRVYMPATLVADQLPITILSPVTSKLYVNIYTAVGSHVFSRQLTIAAGTTAMNVDLSQLQAANYIISISSFDQGHLFTGRFTKR